MKHLKSSRGTKQAVYSASPYHPFSFPFALYLTGDMETHFHTDQLLHETYCPRSVLSRSDDPGTYFPAARLISLLTLEQKKTVSTSVIL